MKVKARLKFITDRIDKYQPKYTQLDSIAMRATPFVFSILNFVPDTIPIATKTNVYCILHIYHLKTKSAFDSIFYGMLTGPSAPHDKHIKMETHTKHNRTIAF